MRTTSVSANGSSGDGRDESFAVIPGCLPIALVSAMPAWSRSGYLADVWMNATADQLIVSAHPDFVAAVEQNRADTR